ncbi:hypothetical protein LTR56_002224 [Elasticomyces elasticus]|nr:hypothetical protein LTR56_002224 [Elasticomyces elasticus]KAK3666104.1 hypothetical protein LTR22_003107 [Elasticomyces elasticus]KAK4929591.1 hypothetical protein LTR49_003886 [Elasticomyces elasticus]KAK5767452.1 hypothetical protein LTS12_002293 [Elasticomyces elasticus]
MSTPKAPGLFRNLWYKWKALHLPWRKQFLVGADLAGNTFWVFKDALHANRWRRIVRYSPKAYYSDVKITPQWHQWLRHTRPEAPSIQEQQYEVSRQAMMKQLAHKADDRWKSVPSFLDAPNKQQALPAMQPKDPGGYAPQTEPENKQGVISAVEDQAKVEVAAEGRDSREVDEGRFKGSTREKPREREAAPWEQQQPKGNAGENWQPAAWSPGVASRR